MNLLNKTLKHILPIDKQRMKEKERELSSLLKTPKGLGKIEELAIQLEGIRQNYSPEKKVVLVMASDNGVEEEGVSKSKRVITQYEVEELIHMLDYAIKEQEKSAEGEEFPDVFEEGNVDQEQDDASLRDQGQPSIFESNKNVSELS